MRSRAIQSRAARSRRIALGVLYEIDVNGAYAGIALDRALERSSSSPRDRALATELVYGVTRWFKTLDWVLDRFSTRPVASLSPWVRNILRMGLYQLMFLRSIPGPVAVNEACELACAVGHPGIVGFVNGILRNILRKMSAGVTARGDARGEGGAGGARFPAAAIFPGLEFPDVERNPVEAISIGFSHPEWLVARWIKQLGVERTMEICRLNNEPPPMSLRANLLKITRRELVELLLQEGVEAGPSRLVPEGVVLGAGGGPGRACKGEEGEMAYLEDAPEDAPDGPRVGLAALGGLTSLRSYRDGLFTIQDESSMLVGHALGPEPGQAVIDACSAPGGKTTHIAEIMGDAGQILAFDIHPHRLDLLRQNLERLDIKSVRLTELDARRLGEHYRGVADRVLVDAPCSGTGALRRRPDARWRKKPEDLPGFHALQVEILRSASNCLKQEGILVYSTCSMEPEEGEDVVREFLDSMEEGGRFAPLNVYDRLPVAFRQAFPDGGCDRRGWLRLFPDIHQVDGFFMAALKLKA
ncbi:MAG: 16S rRNA (cytosine(967)-C(5))-methyltransferase RsmB [Firmicutes bacterium]|nr:16S rRNA (cytosine(967)-C(5))-methyltransferase RsmB [Bacillota bacterium]